LPKQLIERKSARKHGKTWHDRGPTYENARRLYLKYPLLAAVDIARILGVTKQAVFKYVKDEPDLRIGQEKRHEEALIKLKREEGL
jgi:hypothetical protein